MLIDVRQIEDVQRKFTELGDAISAMSESSDALFEQTAESFAEYRMIMTPYLSQGQLDYLHGMVDDISTQQMALQSVLLDVPLKAAEATGILQDTVDEASDGFKSLTDSMKEGSASRLSALTGSISGKLKSKKQASGPKGEADKGKPDTLVRREMKSLSSSLKGMLSKLKIPLPGKILAGGLLWMTFGFQRSQRIQAEAGEVMNQLVGAYDATVKGMVQSGVSYVSGLQETLQRSYGIARSEVQGVVQAFIDGGVGIREAFSEADKSLGLVGQSMTTFALGVDKMFELAGGTTAKRMTSYMADYGKSIEEAKESTLHLMMAGKESGIGTAQFVQNVENAASSLRDYGINIDDVTEAAIALQKHFESLGVPRQFAGRMAAQGLQQASSGLANMRNEWKLLIAEELGLGEGLEGIQALDERFKDLAKGGNKGEWFKMVQSLYNVVERATGGAEAQMKYVLQSALGMKMPGIEAVMEIGNLIKDGKLDEAEKATAKNIGILKDTYKTEKSKTTEWQLHMNEWMDAIAKMGEGMLGMLGNMLALIVQSVRTLFAKGDEKDKLEASADRFAQQVGMNLQQIVGGFKDLGPVAKRMGFSTFGDSFGPMFEALGAGSGGAGSQDQFTHPLLPTVQRATGGMLPEDVVQGVNKLSGAVYSLLPGMGLAGQAAHYYLSDYDRAPSRQAFSRGSSGQGPVRVITVPVQVGAEGTYPLHEAGVYDESGDQAVRIDEESDWFGGQLSVVTTGVDQSGNIGISLVGNCPSCGLIYGDASATSMTQAGLPAYTENDVEALATMLRSEVGRPSGGKYVGETEREAVGIAYTALNRLRAGRYGGSLTDVITGGHGFGKQGSKRAYSTARGATKQSRELARKILEGRYVDPTGGATHFFHSTGGQGYGSKDPSKRTALPKFTQSLVNSANVGRASFWGRSGETTQRAHDADEWKQREINKFRKRRGITPMADVEQGDRANAEYPSVFNTPDNAMERG